ncbi:MAG: hypothetical protein Q8P41_31555 [Pseudomonadota bacterium]|nr:hypothetical protein [Pseudomonadota bacterium]
MKRRLILALVLAVTVAVTGAASADPPKVFITASAVVGATTAVDSGGASFVSCHCWRADAAAVSTSLAYLQGSLDKVHWYRMATFTNVTGMDATYADGGDAVTVVSYPFMRLYLVSASVGTLSCTWMKR